MSELDTFASGAVREVRANKPDVRTALSPQVLRRYVQYMHDHSVAGGFDGGNWKLGIPVHVYLSSLLRHVLDVWELSVQEDAEPVTTRPMEEALCATMFNTMGLLYEVLESRPPESA